MRGLGRASRTRTVRYRGTSPAGSAVPVLRTILAAKGATGVVIVCGCTDALATSSRPPLTRGWPLALLALGVVLIAMAAWGLALSWRSAVAFGTDWLRIRPGTRTAVQVPVSAITGVGLVYRRLGRAGESGSGWYLTIWHGTERPEPVRISYAPALRNGHDARGPRRLPMTGVPAAPAGSIPLPFSLDTFDPATQTDPAKLAATYAGRAASDIYQRVLALQGTAGPLAATEQQKNVRVADSFGTGNVVAYWSPDGVMGRPDTLADF